MIIENEHNQKDPETAEFEKLEFLPEQPDPVGPAIESDTARLAFAPEPTLPDEPPISFSPPAQAAGGEDRSDRLADEPFGQPGADLDLAAETPFELFGTSVFENLDADEDEFPALDLDEPDDDLEF
jgi:hypothetical protein